MRFKRFVKVVPFIMVLLSLSGCGDKDIGSDVSAYLSDKYGVSFEVISTRNGTGPIKGGYTEVLCAPSGTPADEFIVDVEDKSGTMRDYYADIWVAHALEKTLLTHTGEVYDAAVYTKVILRTANAVYTKENSVSDFLEANEIKHIFPAVYISCENVADINLESASIALIANAASEGFPGCELWFYFVKAEEFSKVAEMSGREKSEYVYALNSEEMTYNYTFVELTGGSEIGTTQILANFAR